MVQDSEGRWLRTTVARQVSDPTVDAGGKIVGGKRSSDADAPGNAEEATWDVGKEGLNPNNELEPSDVGERLFEESEVAPEGFLGPTPQVTGA